MTEASCGFQGEDGSLGRGLLIQRGPTLRVDVGFDENYKVDRPKQLAKLALLGIEALIDTGASASCIDAGLAIELQLPIINRATFAGVGGLHHFNVHLAQIRSPELKFTFYGAFAGVDLAAGGQRHSVLIGRDFLSHFRMIYDGQTGIVTLADSDLSANTENWPDE
jgi:hypothetical protein